MRLLLPLVVLVIKTTLTKTNQTKQKTPKPKHHQNQFGYVSFYECSKIISQSVFNLQFCNSSKVKILEHIISWLLSWTVV